MKKWEYQWVVVPHSLGKMKVGGGKVRAHDYVNDLGEQGWELVAVEQGWAQKKAPAPQNKMRSPPENKSGSASVRGRASKKKTSKKRAAKPKS